MATFAAFATVWLMPVVCNAAREHTTLQAIMASESAGDIDPAALVESSDVHVRTQAAIPGHTALAQTTVYSVRADANGTCSGIRRKALAIIEANDKLEVADKEQYEKEQVASEELRQGTTGDKALQDVEDALGGADFDDELRSGEVVTIDDLNDLVTCEDGLAKDTSVLDEHTKTEDGVNVEQGDMVEPLAGGDGNSTSLLEFRLALAEGRRWAGRLWAGGEIRYCFRAGTDRKAISTFRASTQYIAARTCLRFTEIAAESETTCVASSGSSLLVQSHQERACWSYVGDNGRGRNRLNIGQGCWNKGIVVHEIGHALGMAHEQSRPDRDAYVKIHWDNIPEDKRHNFVVERGAYENDAYDVDSLMHYGSKDFAIDRRKPTISSMSGFRSQRRMGQRAGFSDQDLAQVNRMYPCTPPEPIAGSRSWWSCRYHKMHTCSSGKACCCDSGFYYDARKQYCM